MAGTAQEGLTHPPEVNLARRVLARFRLTVPVDVIALARNYAEVSIELIPVDVDGVCYGLKRSNVRPKIVLNKLRPKNRAPLHRCPRARPRSHPVAYGDHGGRYLVAQRQSDPTP